MLTKRVGYRSFILLITAAVVTFSGCSRKQAAVSESVSDKVYVEVEKAERADIEITREFSGKLKPAQEIMIIPKIPGKVANVYVRTGQEVGKGEVLIELDGSDVNLQVAQAEAGYNTSKASIELSRERMTSLSKQKVDLEKAIDTLTKELKEIDRIISEAVQNSGDLLNLTIINVLLTSVRNGTITREQLMESLQGLNLDKAAVEAVIKKAVMEQQLQKLQEGKMAIDNAIRSLPFNESILEAQSKQARVGLDMAANAKNNLRIISPIDGIVANLTAKPGEMVAQTMPPVAVIDISSLILDINITEFEVNKIKPGQEIDIYVDALGKEALKGKIDFVSPNIDLRSQHYPVRIIIENPEKEIKPGMFARAQIITDITNNVVTVPRKSIIREKNKSFVYIVNENQAEKREIVKGLDNGERVEVVSGISEGDSVVVRGQEYVKAGSKIEIARGDNK
jgi:HlyD family secretion protein